MSKKQFVKKIIVIAGPTASGKSDLAVFLAKKINGEIISADSRQVYRGLNLGTSKVKGVWKKNSGKKIFIYQNISHYMIDFANPKRFYSVAEFQKQAKKIIQEILQRKKIPIVIGGTGHWIDALIFDQEIPEVPPNPKLRVQLDKLSTTNLALMLKKKDLRRFKNIDTHNRRRLIRALEILSFTKKPIAPIKLHSPIYPVLWLGLNPDSKTLKQRIITRLKKELASGLVEEVSKLRSQGLSWARLEELGMEYRIISQFLRGKILKEDIFPKLVNAIVQYAKRQKTWFKRNPNIQWITSQKQALRLTNNFFIK